jgi:hypothetical protein
MNNIVVQYIQKLERTELKYAIIRKKPFLRQKI